MQHISYLVVQDAHDSVCLQSLNGHIYDHSMNKKAFVENKNPLKNKHIQQKAECILLAFGTRYNIVSHRTQHFFLD